MLLRHPVLLGFRHELLKRNKHTLTPKLCVYKVGLADFFCVIVCVKYQYIWMITCVCDDIQPGGFRRHR